MLELNKITNEEVLLNKKPKRSKISQQIIDLKVGENLSIKLPDTTFKQREAIRNRVYNIQKSYGRNIKASVAEIGGVEYYVITRDKDDRRRLRTPKGRHEDSIGNQYPISQLAVGMEIKIDSSILTDKSKATLRYKASYISKTTGKDIRTTHQMCDDIKYFVIYRLE
jgi:hypothetical protein